MLTVQHGMVKARTSMVIAAKFHIKVTDLVQELRLGGEQEKKLKECSGEELQKYLLLNHHVLDILKCKAEVLEFKVEDSGSIPEKNRMSGQINQDGKQ